MGRKTFVMYGSWEKAIGKMSDEQAGKLLKAIYATERGEKDAEPDDPSLDLFWSVVQEKLQEDIDAYEDVCQKRSEAGQLGNEKRWGANRKNRKCDKPIAKIASDRKASQLSLESESESESDISTLSGRDTRARTREEDPEPVVKEPEKEEKPEPKQESEKRFDPAVLTTIFRSPKVAEALKGWLDCRFQLGPFPDAAIRDEVEKARQAEEKHGEKACIDAINASLSYKRIVWDKLENQTARSGTKKPGAGFRDFQEREYSSADYDSIAAKMQKRGAG